MILKLGFPPCFSFIYLDLFIFVINSPIFPYVLIVVALFINAVLQFAICNCLL